jgi:hypothetical protein
MAGYLLVEAENGKEAWNIVNAMLSECREGGAQMKELVFSSLASDGNKADDLVL